MATTLEYSKVYARGVPQILKQEQKEYLYASLSGPVEPIQAWKWQSVSWITPLLMTRDDVTTVSQHQNSSSWSGDVNSPSKKKFKMQTSVGKVMCTAFGDRKGIENPSGFPGNWTNYQIWKPHCNTVSAEGFTSRVRSENKTTSLLQGDNTRPHDVQRLCSALFNYWMFNSCIQIILRMSGISIPYKWVFEAKKHNFTYRSQNI